MTFLAWLSGVMSGVILVSAVMVFVPESKPKPTPVVKAEPLVYCLLEKTDFDPYSTTIETMTGAVRFCIAWQTRDKEGEIQ